jgi:hypothetical protein
MDMRVIREQYGEEIIQDEEIICDLPHMPRRKDGSNAECLGSEDCRWPPGPTSPCTAAAAAATNDESDSPHEKYATGNNSGDPNWGFLIRLHQPTRNSGSSRHFIHWNRLRTQRSVLLLLTSGKNRIDLRYLLGSLEIKSKVISSLGL